MSFTQCLRIIISFLHLQPAFIVEYCESHFLKQRGMLWQPFKSCVSLVLRCPLPDGPLCAHCVWVRQREASLRYSGWPDLGQEERHDRSQDSNSIPASTNIIMFLRQNPPEYLECCLCFSIHPQLSQFDRSQPKKPDLLLTSTQVGIPAVQSPALTLLIFVKLDTFT